MNHPRAALVLVALSLPFGAHAQALRWVEIARGDDVAAFVDSTSLRKAGGIAKVWLKWENDPPVPISNGSSKVYRSEKTLSIFNCKARSVATVQVVRYSLPEGTGDIVESGSIPEAEAKHREVVPDTMAEHVLNWVCMQSDQ